MKNDFQTTCKEILSVLNPKQREVLSRRFGLAKAECDTLQTIGSDFKITRERVRQIEKDSLKKLKNQKLPKTYPY
jgi:DNA-directed RNA polymerase sigma subunit (sigma70/sigma32)